MTTLQEAEAYPLGDDDINKILEPDTHIFTYPYLKQVKDIDEIFDPYGRAMMLYLTENKNTGHWVCLIRRPDEIEFFDPYGEPVDKQLTWVGKGKRTQLEQDRPLLSKLLREKGVDVVCNKTKFQLVDDDVATCGRHCVIRLLFKDLPLPKYAEMIKKSGMTPDEFVTRKTYDLLGK